FFFSSRRRHTRFSRDWSSDVCSSDLDRKEAIRPIYAHGNRKSFRLDDARKTDLLRGEVLGEQLPCCCSPHAVKHLLGLQNGYQGSGSMRQYRDHFTAIQEISTLTSLGSRLTSTVSRAGGLSPK